MVVIRLDHSNRLLRTHMLTERTATAFSGIDLRQIACHRNGLAGSIPARYGASSATVALRRIHGGGNLISGVKLGKRGDAPVGSSQKFAGGGKAMPAHEFDQFGFHPRQN